MKWAFVTNGRAELELALAAALEHGERPRCVVTHEGVPIVDYARAHELDVVTVDGLNGREDLLHERGIELGVTCGLSELLGPRVLSLPRHGWLNCHPSPLPAYRGADPIGWQLVSRPTRIGLTIHESSAHFDEGPIVRSGSVPVIDADTRSDVSRRVFTHLGEMLAAVLAEGPHWDARPQTGPASFCPPRGVAALIDPTRIAASRALGVIRAFAIDHGVGILGYDKLVHGAEIRAPLAEGEVPGAIRFGSETMIACLDHWIVVTDAAETTGAGRERRPP